MHLSQLLNTRDAYNIIVNTATGEYMQSVGDLDPSGRGSKTKELTMLTPTAAFLVQTKSE